MSGPAEQLLNQVNASGYPFQLMVANIVSETTREHGWTVASQEHPWKSPDGSNSGFIDIVLESQNTLRLVVECKRNKAQDSRQLNWIFLLPGTSVEKEQQLASCLEVEGWTESNEQPGSNPGQVWRDLQIWDNVRLTPASLQAEFCVHPSDGSAKQPTLEKLATEVLDSMEGLANEEVQITRSMNENHRRLFVFGAIVTNSLLSVFRFDPSKVKPTNGSLDLNDVTIEEVPFIRFRKSLATDFPKGSFRNLKASSRARERTVFVVNAEKLPEFLKGWETRGTGEFGEYAIQSYLRGRRR